MTKYPPPFALTDLFDSDFYLSQCSGDIGAHRDPLDHFTTVGWLQGWDPHPLFSVRYYLYQKQELLNARINPLLHYMMHGSAEEIDPHPLFDTRYYRAQVPHLGEIPLLHYLKDGYKALSPHPLFDLAFYREQVRVATMALIPDDTPPLVHYVLEGVKDSLSPHPLFCSLFYCSRRPDVIEQKMNPLVHYIQFGSRENEAPHPLLNSEYFARTSGVQLTKFPNPLLAFLNLNANECSPHRLFDITYYRSQLSARGVTELEEHPLVHYLRTGHRLGFNPHPLFDTHFYRTNNPYLRTYDMEPLTHYVAWGVEESRNPHPLFDSAWYTMTYPDKQKSGMTPLEAYLEDWHSGGESDPCWALSTRYYLAKRPGCRSSNVPPPFHFYSYFRLPLTVQNETVSFPSDDFSGLYSRFNSRVGIQRDRAPVRIIITSHDATRTGAPLIALNIGRELRKRYGVECFIILERGGALLKDFQELGEVVVIDDLRRKDGINNIAPHVMALLKPSRTVAIVNSIECADILRLLVSMGIPCYSLIHEFTERYNEYNVANVLENSRIVVFPSETVKSDALTHHSRLSTKASDAKVIPQGLNDPSFLEGSRQIARTEILRELNLPEDCTIVLTVGQIQSRKGADLFILAARQFMQRNPDRHAVFVWVGDSDKSGVLYEDFLHSDVHRAGLADRVLFIGPRDDTRSYFYAADIYLHLARLDPFPCVVLEAMAAALPVVVFDGVNGASEIVRDDAGFVLPFLDMSGVHDALTRLVNEPELRHRQGRCGRTRIEESFSFSTYVNTLLGLICDDRGWRQIGSFERTEPAHHPQKSLQGKVPVFFAASSWGIRGVNILWRHLIAGLRARGWDARILFTDRLIAGETYREPQIPHCRVSHAIRDTTQERWTALQNFLMQQAECIFVTGDDYKCNSIVSALPDHIGVIGTLLDGSGESYEQGYRIGMYCNRIIGLSEEFTRVMSGYNPGLNSRTITISADAIDRATPLAWRTTRRPGAPLQIVMVGASKDNNSAEEYVALLKHLSRSSIPFGITFIIDETTPSLTTEIETNLGVRLPRGSVRSLSHAEPEQLTQLLEEHDVLLVMPHFNAPSPLLTESISRGCIPVIVKPHGNLSPLVRDGENSVVLQDDDLGAIAEVLKDLYTNLPRMLGLQHAALQSRQSEYTVDLMVDHYERILQGVAEETKARRWNRPKPFVWSPHFGDALPPQDLIYRRDALMARKGLES